MSNTLRYEQRIICEKHNKYNISQIFLSESC